MGRGRGARLGQRRLGLIHLLRGQIKLSGLGRSQQNMKETEGECVTPVKDPWLSLGSDCGGSGWTGPRRPLKSLESLSSGQELGPTHFRVGSEEDCPQESWAPEGQSESAVKPQLVLLVSVQSHMIDFSYVCCTRTTEQKATETLLSTDRIYGRQRTTALSNDLATPTDHYLHVQYLLMEKKGLRLV